MFNLFKKNRCKHQWREVRRTWNPPINTGAFGGFLFADEKKATFGFTNIETQCKLCGRLELVAIIGRAEKERVSE